MADQLQTEDRDTPPSRRVLVVVRWPVGGIRTWCRYVYRRPQFDQYQIDLVIPEGAEAQTLAEDMSVSGLDINVIRTGPKLRQLALKASSLILRGRYSLVHSHGFSSAAICGLPCRIRGVPHLATIHEEILADQYRDLRGRVIRSTVNATLARMDCVHAVSNASGDNPRSAFPGAARCRHGIRVVSNGIDSERFLTATALPLRADLGLPAETTLVGFFGRFMAPKGFRYLIEALRLHSERQSPKRDLVVVAIGGGGFKREEEATVRSLGLGSKFVFLDFMADIAGALKAVDVVAMPSLWEASGLLAMEALTSGVPLVVSRASGLAEVTAGTPAASVPVADAAALLEGILEMSSVEHKVAARAFSQIAAERFDVGRARAQMADIYDTLIAGRHDAVSPAKRGQLRRRGE